MPLEYEDILGIKEAIFEGIPQRVVAKRFLLDPSTVSKICRGHLYPEVPWPSGQTGGLDPVEYRKIRFELRQSEAATPLAETPLGGMFLDEEVAAIEGASRLLGELGHLFDDGEVEFDAPVAVEHGLDPDDPELDRQLAGAAGTIGTIDPVAQLEKIRQDRLRSLKKQRAALDEMGEAAAKQLDREIEEVAGMVEAGEVDDPRPKVAAAPPEGWSWDEVLTNARDHVVVQMVEDHPDEFPDLAAAQRAVGVVLKVLPERRWGAKSTVDLIAELTKELSHE